MKNVVSLPDILCKHEIMTIEFDHLTDRTKAIVLFTTQFMISNFGVIPIWTSFYRPKVKGKSASVHNYNRGADMSRRAISFKDGISLSLISDKNASIIVNAINQIFPYGKGQYKTCMYHKVAGSVLHFHFQSAI